MAPHQERVVTEKRELDEKLAKLNAFFITETFLALDSETRATESQQMRAAGFISKRLPNEPEEPCHECGGDRISRQSEAAFRAKLPCPSCAAETPADDRSPCCGRRHGLHHDMCPKQPL